jgi:glycosyltransferase involved in cell wall biosynthesis
MPSKFESESLPVWEAARFGVPIITAKTTAIPSQIGQGALYFDPDDPDKIANVIEIILKDPGAAQKIVDFASLRVSKLKPTNTGLGYRYAYRRILQIERDKLDFEWENFGFTF